jgi:hypothetical protein
MFWFVFSQLIIGSLSYGNDLKGCSYDSTCTVSGIQGICVSKRSKQSKMTILHFLIVLVAALDPYPLDIAQDPTTSNVALVLLARLHLVVALAFKPPLAAEHLILVIALARVIFNAVLLVPQHQLLPLALILVHKNLPHLSHLEQMD